MQQWFSTFLVQQNPIDTFLRFEELSCINLLEPSSKLQTYGTPALHWQELSLKLRIYRTGLLSS